MKGVQEDEIELDIDELSNEVLFKLLGFVRKYAPRPDDSPPARQPPAPAPVQASHPKKNKPMSKNEQESRIREIQSKLSKFESAGSDQSPEPGECSELSRPQQKTLLILSQTQSPMMTQVETKTTAKRAKKIRLTWRFCVHLGKSLACTVLYPKLKLGEESITAC